MIEPIWTARRALAPRGPETPRAGSLILKPKKKLNRPDDGLVAERHDDDGLDPRFDPSPYPGRQDGRDRKQLQLCKQAARALQTALSGECADPVLNQLEVVSVLPMRGGNLLEACVRQADDPPPAEDAEVLARLQTVTGFLRAAVAEAIVRRRAPELRFTVMPSTGGAS